MWFLAGILQAFGRGDAEILTEFVAGSVQIGKSLLFKDNEKKAGPSLS